MANYLPSTPAERQEMLQEMGYADMQALLQSVPAEVRLERPLNLPHGQSELQVTRTLERLAACNTRFDKVFRGAGAYRHFIPAVVRHVAGKEEFVTAYTPYQAELSQGVLQSIYEYQTMICELTGMDVSNASVYDGATAAAEAVMMCVDRRRTRVLVSAGVHPQTLEVVRTYCAPHGLTVEETPLRDGVTDVEALAQRLDETTACVLTQQPNYLGNLEDCDALAAAIHASKAKFILSCNPTALGMLRTPGECGADIAVGDGQPLGLPLSYGGPYLGYMACKAPLMRKLPGRIVGQTQDEAGKRAFVLTLQAREQHIRREKASSSICSNQALCALTAAVYLAALGPEGLREVAEQCRAKAAYCAEQLRQAGFEPVYDGPFFHEFVTTCPVEADVLLERLEQHGILGGLPLPDGNLLWCVTEVLSRADIDEMAAICKEVAQV